VTQGRVDSWNPFKDLDTWWFGKGSPVTLGLLRVLMGLIALASLILTLFDFEAWYTDRGFTPAQYVANWLRLPSSFKLGTYDVHLPVSQVPRINLLGPIDDPRVTLIFYILVMLAAVLTTLGLWTRISTILLALGIVTIHHRNPFILHSGDTLLRLTLIYLAWAPSGAACSLDRVIRVWRGKESGEPPNISLWGQRLIQYQVALVYFTTVWWKWFGTYWKDGTATWYPENLNEFYRFPTPDFLRHQPFIAFTTYGTLATELSLATLVFYRPLRKYVLLAGIAMHCYIEYRFNIPFFAITIVATYLAFYDGEEVSAWARRVGERLRRFRLVVQLPLRTSLRPGPALAVQALDPLSLVTYEPGLGQEWAAFDIMGRPKRPFFGSWIRSVGAWPIGFVPRLWRRLLKSALMPAEPSEARQPVQKGKVKAQKSK
jgi:hypothetical protein